MDVICVCNLCVIIDKCYQGNTVFVHLLELVTLVLVTMAPFLRIAFNSYDLGVLPPLADPPFCAIKMKEALTTGEKLFNSLHHRLLQKLPPL